MPKFQKEMQGIPKKLNSATGYLVAVFNSFGAEYRGATFVGVERQSLQQVKGGSHYPVNDACVIKYWVLPDAKKQVGSKLPTLRSKEKSRKRGNEK